MTGGDVQSAYARTLVDEWARCGIEVAAVSPGSRSTPLALALVTDGRIRVEVFVDERSAAFFAVGVGRASGRPAVVLCTSGTAAANFHPAVLEAWHGRVPLVVATADRPPELRDTGAGQATDQIKLYGASVRWFCEVGAADVADPTYWRSVAARSVAEASGPPAGPVHLNLAFREPLVPAGDVVVDAGRPGGRPWVTTAVSPTLPDDDELDGLAAAIAATPKGLLVAGWGCGVSPEGAGRFAAAAGWPIVADAISGVRTGPLAVSSYDALLRVPAVAGRLRPDLVLHVGAALTGKVATSWLDAGVPRILVDPDRAWLDPHRGASERVVADAGALLDALADRLETYGGVGHSKWLTAWGEAEATARAAIDAWLDHDDVPSEPRAARDLVDCLPEGASVVVGSSMPVRDIEAFARPRGGVRFHSNRGVNGIDGFVSTVLGVAAAAGDGEGPVVGLCGDLTFLHDAGGLLEASRRALDAVFVVIDNRGGGIFSFLPQAALADAQFETLWGTPHHLDLVALCRVHGIPAVRIGWASDLVRAVRAALDGGGVRVVIVPTERGDNVTRHRRAHQAVAEALE
ncbi:MAG: 2-succinyl-5-enolpyruvyl-6-hydroxy-3-cyclohexene-carboxylate synthase [Actinomycetota bacterium]|jgi:2-succinyl-5-enolpyruvyl-6-hydroxy-3-cyclohexene-1-carboxylate synthase|nr:2-succinyl-5-enolpyruvyl-6-hydroxy-3-cyclohexene-carboxylate synthase [Actinomycetota bacterium]